MQPDAPVFGFIDQPPPVFRLPQLVDAEQPCAAGEAPQSQLSHMLPRCCRCA
jgi:hypothetical protein